MDRRTTPDARKALTQAARKQREWRAKRDELIREAVEAGGSYREVAEAVGLSHTAVRKIAANRRTTRT